MTFPDTERRSRFGMTKRQAMPRCVEVEVGCPKNIHTSVAKILTGTITNAFISRYEEFRRSGRGLYIYSATKGSGKTLLACCLANEVMERYNAVVKFVQVLDYIDLIKRKDEDADMERHSLKRCGLLILDDVGVQTEKQEWINNAIFSLIDERYRNLLPTLYTSNVPIEKASGDDRIQSRIYGTSIPMLLPEISVRDQLADKYRDEFLRTVLN